MIGLCTQGPTYAHLPAVLCVRFRMPDAQNKPCLQEMNRVSETVLVISDTCSAIAVTISFAQKSPLSLPSLSLKSSYAEPISEE